jgi:hypothetical protein
MCHYIYKMSNNNNSKIKRKYKSVDLEIKYKVINDISNGDKYEEVVKRYNLGGTYTVSKFVKNKEKIIKSYESQSHKNKVRVREPKFKLVEEALVKFLEEFKNDTNLPVSGNLLKEQALFFAEKFGVKGEFKASDGWLQKFIVVYIWGFWDSTSSYFHITFKND